MKDFLGLRAKIYSYLIDVSSEDKRSKGTKTCIGKKISYLKIMKNKAKRSKST